MDSGFVLELTRRAPAGCGLKPGAVLAAARRARSSALRPVVVRPRALSSALSSATVSFAETETETGGELAEVEV